MKLQPKLCQRAAKCPLKYFANLSATSSTSQSRLGLDSENRGIRAFQFLFLFPVRGRVAFQASEKKNKTKILLNSESPTHTLSF